MLLLLLAALGCRPADPCDLGARPRTIDAIGGLPSPVTLECFLVSLERPLGLELSADVFSAQPAEPGSPRVFVRNEGLTLSVVPAGESRHLLELGEHDASGLTVKAEIAFPVELPLDPMAPFERVYAPDGVRATGCALCHLEEVEVGPLRYASTPLRPRTELVVPLEELFAAHEACDPAADALRCAMLAALLDHGEVEHSPFPAAYATILPE